MKPPLGPRLAVFGATTLICSGAALFYLSARRRAEVLTFHEPELELAEELVASTRGAAEEDALGRVPLSDEALRDLFKINPRLRRTDPHCYFTYKPGLELESPWAEHPDGVIVKRTNSLGDHPQRRGERDAAGTARARGGATPTPKARAAPTRPSPPGSRPRSRGTAAASRC